MKKLAVSLSVIVSICCSVLGGTAYAAASDEKSKIHLHARGDSFIDDYERYGKFINVGTTKYQYKVRDFSGLSRASGEGVYPNTEVYDNPRYKELVAQKKLNNDIWSYVNTDPEIDFFAWASIRQLPNMDIRTSNGTKLFFIGEALRAGGEYLQAIKAYYALVIMFPDTPCWSADGSFMWYMGPAAIDRINAICREHPELKIKLEGAYIESGNIKVDPGKFVPTEQATTQTIDITQNPVIKKRGAGTVRLVKYSNGQWQLMVNNKPYLVKGITYAPTKIGLTATTPGRETQWMFTDTNNNNIIDAPYESFNDKNKNNMQDSDEPTVGDFALLRDMGVNTIRTYHMLSTTDYLSQEFNKPVLRDLYNTYGIRVIMGDFFGSYGFGSGTVGITDYRDPIQRARMKDNVRKMVLDHKDEPYILMWILGNENDMSETNIGENYTRTNAAQFPKEYAQFVNEVAIMIHQLDPNHPVIVGNFSTNFLNEYAAYTPEIDVYGLNAYMGKDGFGNTWQIIRRKIDLPVLITEYGCDAYSAGKGEDQASQVTYHKGNWDDIVYNTAGNQGAGNAIGGIIFEWLDEWWKDSTESPLIHSINPASSMPFSDGWAHEEWFGLAGQGDGSKSPFLRQLRTSYFSYKDTWNKK